MKVSGYALLNPYCSHVFPGCMRSVDECPLLIGSQDRTLVNRNCISNAYRSYAQVSCIYSVFGTRTRHLDLPQEAKGPKSKVSSALVRINSFSNAFI